MSQHVLTLQMPKSNGLESGLHNTGITVENIKGYNKTSFKVNYLCLIWNVSDLKETLQLLVSQLALFLEQFVKEGLGHVNWIDGSKD